MKRRSALVSLLLLFFLPLFSFSQDSKKTMGATRITTPIVIDGVLDEPAWAGSEIATDFIQRVPYNGKPATRKTDVRVLYDNSGMYIGAMMYDEHPDSILRQLSLRDGSNVNADYFIAVINPFNDGLNAFCFMVFASDVQNDFRIIATANSDDPTWDAVWQSKARITDQGWICEMKIPFSAIRFSKAKEQVWEVNFQRDIRRTRETSTWTLIDSKINSYVNQCGKLTGITDIKPPLRLSLMPYVSGYVQKDPVQTASDGPESGADQNKADFSYNYGTDLKYGINQSFTLDMTLIPDFGQVPSDDKIYNFSPFEIRYDEKRQFFTEGTEMFNKGGIFYSRRVGDEPVDYGNISTNENEIITKNPTQTKLINASKISGRTNKGLGIGFFNAMSANTWATVQDTLTGESRRVLTQGFTNYNMIVFDQSLKNNSFIDLLNTNYYIPEKGYSANVSGTSFKFANKKFTYALTGDGFVSQKYYSHDKPETGFHYSLEYGKISGNFQFSLNQLVENDTYDPNDMGFNARNNKFNNSLSLQYNIYEPFGKFLAFYNYFYAEYNCLYDDLKYTSFSLGLSSHIRTVKYLDFGINLNTSPVDYNDYYEPRVSGYYFVTPADYNFNGWLSTDYRKKLAMDVSLGGYVSTGFETVGYFAEIDPRYRITDRFTIGMGIGYNDVHNGIGYVLDSLDNNGNQVILFGRRDVTEITNVISGTYMFNSKMSVNLRARHYWVQAPYYSFYQLDKSGHLNPVAYTQDEDVNFNLFNLDLTYIWNFAPGSQLSVVWKNAISTMSEDVVKGYFKDLGNTLSSPASNSFSIRILYYLDALYFKKKRA